MSALSKLSKRDRKRICHYWFRIIVIQKMTVIGRWTIGFRLDTWSEIVNGMEREGKRLIQLHQDDFDVLISQIGEVK